MNKVLSSLRHLYANMVNGAVRDTASSKRIAEGLLAPAIAEIERTLTPQAGAESYPPSEAEQVMRWLDDNCKRVGWSIDTATYEITDTQALRMCGALRARGAVPSDYLRIAELVRHARDNRGSKDWPLMHTDLSEAAEIADKLAAAPQPPAVDANDAFLQEMHNALYAAQLSEGKTRLQHITKARILLSDWRAKK